jgi:hypothetical protein
VNKYVMRTVSTARMANAYRAAALQSNDVVRSSPVEVAMHCRGSYTCLSRAGDASQERGDSRARQVRVITASSASRSSGTETVGR